MFNIVARRYWFFGLSLLVIVPGLISLLTNGLRTGIDFAGGTVWDIVVPNRTTPLSTEEVRKIFEAAGARDAHVQVSPPDAQKRVIASVRTREVKESSPEKAKVVDGLKRAFPGMILESFTTIGATVSQQSTRSAFFAVGAASIAILGYLTLAFRTAPHPVRYGVAAIVAMLHDVLVVLGVASILGWLIGLEVDALFLTALLTVISFSVHDTIVVFDRIREDLRLRRSNQSFEDVVNTAIVQTLTRSINTQLTVLFTLLALILFGGPTIRNFILVLTIGLISGTYSSIFNAAQILVVWENGWGRDFRNVFRRHERVSEATA
ncbi:MAG TPA: protein translocase subunit SecF [Herpetosiphonaceae bacterium]|nr:protein translocase subunit SecF [Herpetosiphonaceae bacterium]